MPPILTVLKAMKIAFYAPLKSPNHATPSGDRTMARLLIKALQMAGYSVDVISNFRSYLNAPNPDLFYQRQQEAQHEVQTLARAWQIKKPDIMVCYHPYYKAPDFIGASLCAQFSVPYIAIEASVPSQKNQALWRVSHDYVLQTIKNATGHVCLTTRDFEGLKSYVQTSRLKILPPFLETQNFPQPNIMTHEQGQPIQLICAAMMRSGAKLRSYQFLAKAMSYVRTLWQLTIIGDGDCRLDVEQAFAGFDNRQIKFMSALSHNEVLNAFNAAHLYVWPGFDEAYGMAYLEAASMGLPCIALDTAGVSAVIENGRTGVCVRPHTQEAFAAAIDRLVYHPNEHLSMAHNAVTMAREERTLKNAAKILDDVLRNAYHGFLS